MRLLRLLMFVAVMCATSTIILASGSLDVTATIGFGGYYRARTLVPVAIHVKNHGGTFRGEFSVISDSPDVLLFRNSMPVTVPKGANQLLFLYIMPQRFTTDLKVVLRQKGRLVKAVPIPNSYEVYDTDRLIVVVGGSGSSFSGISAKPVSIKSRFPMPRAWDNIGWSRRSGGYYGGPSGPGGSMTGQLKLAYVHQDLLPDNAEAYSSITALALMSDVTENMLRSGVQQAIPMWASTGGQVLLAGGGVEARFDAPFFTELWPSPTDVGVVDVVASPDGGSATVRRYGQGYVTRLDFDPDSVMPSNWMRTLKFYQALLFREPAVPAPLELRQAVSSAIMVRNLRPPNLTLIVIYLLCYLVMLVPVNYFVLKKLDKRELAWVTTPVIVLLFSLGAYGIGYATKGHRLVMNMVSIVETGANQHQAEAVSSMLIFSPARTSYDMSLGANALYVDEYQEDYNPYGYQESRPTSSMTLLQRGNSLAIEHIGVNMWDFRQFTSLHQIDIGKGITGKLKPNAPATSPRATGTVTNNTPFNFQICSLYYKGAFVAEFPLASGQTVDVTSASGSMKTLPPDTKFMLDTLKNQTGGQVGSLSSLNRGFVLLGYTTELSLPVEFNGRGPTTNVALFVAHLD